MTTIDTATLTATLRHAAAGTSADGVTIEAARRGDSIVVTLTSDESYTDWGRAVRPIYAALDETLAGWRVAESGPEGERADGRTGEWIEYVREEA